MGNLDAMAAADLSVPLTDWGEVAEADGAMTVRVLWPALLAPEDVGVGVLVWQGDAYSPVADWVDAGEPVTPERGTELVRDPAGAEPESWTVLAVRREAGCWVLTVRRPVE